MYNHLAIQKARKEYSCKNCGCIISPKELYTRCETVTPHKLVTAKYCMDCAKYLKLKSEL